MKMQAPKAFSVAFLFSMICCCTYLWKAAENGSYKLIPMKLSGSGISASLDQANCTSGKMAVPTGSLKWAEWLDGSNRIQQIKRLPQQCHPHLCQEARRRQVSQYCKRKRAGGVRKRRPGQSEGPSSHTLAKLLVDDVHKVLYCFVPKVACTNWKRVLLLVTGHWQNVTDPVDIPSFLVHKKAIFGPSVPSLSNFSKKEQAFRLATYYKFMFVRNPLERLLSAYRNKFKATWSGYFRRRYGPQINGYYQVINSTSKSVSLGDDDAPVPKAFPAHVRMKRENSFVKNKFGKRQSTVKRKNSGTLPGQQKLPKDPKLLNITGNGSSNIPTRSGPRAERQSKRPDQASLNVTFERFLSWLADTGGEDPHEEAPNAHWDSFDSVCNPCQIQYDFIGRYEELEKEADMLLRGVFHTDAIHFPTRSDSYEHAKTSLVASTQYEDIHPGVIKRLLRRYSADFEMFGYTC